MPTLTFIGTFVGGGLLGAMLTAVSDNRLNRRAIDAQLLAEQRAVAAGILVHFQRAKNSLSVIHVGDPSVPQLNRAINTFAKSAELALELMPEVTLTVTDQETRTELTAFLRALASILAGPVATALEAAHRGDVDAFLAMSEELSGAGERLDRIYGVALDAAVKNLGTATSRKNWFSSLRSKKKGVSR